MADRLLKIAGIPGLGGINPSLHDHLFGNEIFFKDGMNVVFDAEGIKKMPGWTRAFTPSTLTTSAVTGLIALAATSNARCIYYGTRRALYRWDEGLNAVSVVATGFTGTAVESNSSLATLWSFAEFGNWAYATNGKEPVMVNKSGNFETASVGNAFRTAEILIKRGTYLLAFNLTKTSGTVQNNKISWCTSDNTEDWSANPTNSAGSLTIRDLDSGIIAAKEIGDRIAIYSKNNMFILSYVDVPFYFGVQPAVSGIGAVSKHAIVTVGRLNYGLSKIGFFETDGVTFNWIDLPNIRLYFRSIANNSNLSKAVGVHDAANTQVVWWFPTGSSVQNTHGLGYDYARKLWTIYDHGRSAAADEGTFGNFLAAGDGGKVYFHNSGKNADGTAPIGCYIESAKIDLGEPGAYKEFLEMRVGVTELTAGLSIKMATVDSLTESASWGTAYSLDQSLDKIDIRLHGKFVQFRIEQTATSGSFLVSSIALSGRAGGTD